LEGWQALGRWVAIGALLVAVMTSRGTDASREMRRLREILRLKRWVEQAEAACARFVAGWNARGPKARTGAAEEERQ